MRKKGILNYLKPPKDWFIPVNFMLAIFIGLFCYSMYVSNAISYLSDEPETCINCHVMEPNFASWEHSSHREVATCVDCHVPHDNLFKKYYFKAKDGLRHATIFTMRTEPQVIVMKEDGNMVVQENCKACHSHANSEVGLLNVTYENSLHGEGKLCWDCHREVPHGRVKSLSSTPNALTPKLGSPVPDWIKESSSTTEKK